MPRRPPDVEMVWEDDDPQSALADRFGFARNELAGAWIEDVVRSGWAIDGACRRIVLSDRNALAWLDAPQGEFVAKWSVAPERFERLGRVATLTRWLGEEGRPVAAPLPRHDGEVQVEIDGVSLQVQHVVTGALLDTEDGVQVRAAGAALADLHAALGRYDGPDPTSTPLHTLRDRLEAWCRTPPEHLAMAAVGELRRRVARLPDDPGPEQLLHGDYRGANILCGGGEVVAVLDLEEVRRGPCVDELARAAVLLGTHFRGWGPVAADVHAAFLAGYESRRSLTAAESPWWSALTLWHTLQLVPVGADPTGWGSAALDLIGR